jgi:hypothetical protein
VTIGDQCTRSEFAFSPIRAPYEPWPWSLVLLFMPLRYGHALASAQRRKPARSILAGLYGLSFEGLQPGKCILEYTEDVTLSRYLRPPLIRLVLIYRLRGGPVTSIMAMAVSGGPLLPQGPVSEPCCTILEDLIFPDGGFQGLECGVCGRQKCPRR